MRGLEWCLVHLFLAYQTPLKLYNFLTVPDRGILSATEMMPKKRAF